MKICHLTSVHPRYDSRIFGKECNSLANNGYDVSFIVADDNGNETKNNIKIYDVKKDSSRLKRMLKTPQRVFKKALEVDADVYHFHDPELMKTGIKLLKHGKKVIYDVHEDVPRQILSKAYLKSFSKKIISKIFERFENRNSAKYTYVITATDFIKNRFLKINKNSESLKNFPIINELSNSKSWSEKKNEACYIGALAGVRGVKEIVEAMGFSDYKLNIAGKFSSADFQLKVEKIDSWKKVNFYGFVDRNEVKEILEISKVGLVTLYPIVSYKDALPVKMFEYMLAGIPVISSDIPLWKEIVDTNNCGICVNPYNPKDIADALNYLLGNDELAEKMGQNGKNAVLEKYNWANEEKRLLNIYKSIEANL